jgi:hypothetical protein
MTNDEPKDPSRVGRKLLVRCTLYVEVSASDALNGAEVDDFDINENSCPGTHRVGAAIDAAIEAGDTGKTHACWACALHGKNELLGFADEYEFVGPSGEPQRKDRPPEPARAFLLCKHCGKPRGNCDCEDGSGFNSANSNEG